MKPFISKSQRFHAWQGTSGYLLSDETLKKLTAHKTTDDLVNYLWLAGFKIEAREFNAHVKAGQV